MKKNSKHEDFFCGLINIKPYDFGVFGCYVPRTLSRGIALKEEYDEAKHGSVIVFGCADKSDEEIDDAVRKSISECVQKYKNNALKAERYFSKGEVEARLAKLVQEHEGVQ